MYLCHIIFSKTLQCLLKLLALNVNIFIFLVDHNNKISNLDYLNLMQLSNKCKCTVTSLLTRHNKDRELVQLGPLHLGPRFTVLVFQIPVAPVCKIQIWCGKCEFDVKKRSWSVLTSDMRMVWPCAVPRLLYVESRLCPAENQVQGQWHDIHYYLSVTPPVYLRLYRHVYIFISICVY